MADYTGLADLILRGAQIQAQMPNNATRLNDLGNTLGNIGNDLASAKMAALQKQKMQAEVDKLNKGNASIGSVYGYDANADQKMVDQNKAKFDQLRQQALGLAPNPIKDFGDQVGTTAVTDNNGNVLSEGQPVSDLNPPIVPPNQLHTDRQAFMERYGATPETTLNNYKEMTEAQKNLAKTNEQKVWVNPANPKEISWTPKEGWPEVSQGSALNAAALTGRTENQMENAKSKFELERQDRLEKEYAALQEKTLSNKSGDLGMQNSKVSAAIHLRNMFDQYYNPKTGGYDIPASQYEELALGLAALVSGGTNNVSDSLRQGIMQRTAKGDINGAIGYITGTTPSGSTDQVFKNLAESVDRQGTVSEDLRNKYFEQMKTKRPKGLDPERADRLEKTNFGSSYRETLANSIQARKAMAQNMGTTQSEPLQSSEVERDVNGRRAVFDANTKQFLRWK